MDFSIKTSGVETLRTACAIVPVLGARKLTAGGQALDAALGGNLSAALSRGDLPAKAGATLLVYGAARRAQRVVLVCVGDEGKVTERSFADAARGALRAASTLAIDEAVSLLHEADVAGRALDWQLRTQVLAARDASYRFDQLKSKKDNHAPRPGKLHFAVSRGHSAGATKAVARAQALANGMAFARDLGNLPGNVCTPAYLANAAKTLARQFGMKAQVLERKQMEALRMGSLLAVARGSSQAPKLIVVQYQGGQARDKPIALVGKGITFDTGGISLKPAAEMDEMKYDMSGAASVLGTLRAIAEMKLPINVVGVIPAAENMPGGSATRPGDIVTSMSGQTIEILNTDAEGRLILCDALTYTERFKPAAVVDIATLTGACVIALGGHRSGMFSPSDELAADLLLAGDEMNDPCWRMPLDEEYHEGIKSPFADVANVGGRPGGAITAACFLSRFAKAYDWAHLDVAGTAWRGGKDKGSNGRPVPLLTGFLMARAGE